MISVYIFWFDVKYVSMNTECVVYKFRFSLDQRNRTTDINAPLVLRARPLIMTREFSRFPLSTWLRTTDINPLTMQVYLIQRRIIQ